MARAILAAALVAILGGCAGDLALVRCALVQHDINRRCS